MAFHVPCTQIPCLGFGPSPTRRSGLFADGYVDAESNVMSVTWVIPNNSVGGRFKFRNVRAICLNVHFWDSDGGRSRDSQRERRRARVRVRFPNMSRGAKDNNNHAPENSVLVARKCQVCRSPFRRWCAPGFEGNQRLCTPVPATLGASDASRCRREWSSSASDVSGKPVTSSAAAEFPNTSENTLKAGRVYVLPKVIGLWRINEFLQTLEVC